jgi:hypothetical protein
MIRPLASNLATAWLVLAAAGCAAPGRSQVSFVSNERPTGYNAPQATSPSGTTNPNGMDLAEDDLIEPEHPLADTKEERAVVHIHGPKDVCSGVVVGPRLVATAQRCLRGLGKGVTTLAADREYRVEVASSNLTWTNRKARHAVLPQCDDTELDIGILVLDEPVPSLVVPLKIVSAPNIGARVRALGFGHCADTRDVKDRSATVRSRDGRGVVIDVPLCKGDIGGPVIDGRDGDVIGLISRRDDPEGSPLKTTTIARLDSTFARDLLAQSKLLADGAATISAVACR